MCKFPLSPLLARLVWGTFGRLTIVDFLCEAEVHQFQMALGVYENVFRLQVSVSNSFLLMQEFQNQHNLGGVELRGWLVEATCSAQIAENFTAGAVIKLRGSVSKSKNVEVLAAH